MKYNISIFLYVAFMLTMCSPKHQITYQRSGSVTCANHDRTTITLVSEGQATDIQQSVLNAERNAIENLLFKGIPNSNQEKAIIANEIDSKNTNSDFLHSFIEGFGYQKYLIESVLEENHKHNGVYFIRQRTKFDLTNMRKYLTDNKVIKGFGL